MASVADIADALTDLGLEVEGIDHQPCREAEDAFTIGKVIHAEQHPDADRLRVCKVADRTRASCRSSAAPPMPVTGITAVHCQTRRPMCPASTPRIGVGKIRGDRKPWHDVPPSARWSFRTSMTASSNCPRGEIGETLCRLAGGAHDPAKVDPVIEIAITPNRPDALGVRGIALDLAARGHRNDETRAKTRTCRRVSFDSPITISIDDDTLCTDGCEVFAGRLIRGVTNGPSARSGCRNA